MRFEPLVRRRLVDRIRKAAQYRVAIIAASAGFGKSTALRHFLAGESGYVRYDVRPENATLVAFVRGFTGALAPVLPHLRGSFASAFESALQAAEPIDALAQWLHENLKDAHLTVLIDDLHHVEFEPDILRLLTRLVERSTPDQRWILSTRTAMSFPVATWWERGSMALPIDETELHFTQEEGREVARRANVSLSDADIDNIHALTAGWPMAFILGLSVEGGLSGASQLAMQGRTREVVYRSLAARAFSCASPEAQQFMLDTCKFPAIRKSSTRNAILLEVEQFGSLVERISDQRFRYTDLFREYLEQKLKEQGAGAIRDALLRAARNFEEENDFGAALRLSVDAGSIIDVTRIMESHGFELIENGNSDAVISALGSLSEEQRDAAPVFIGLQAVLEAQRGRHDTSDAWFRAAIEGAPSGALRADLSNRYAQAMLHRYRADSVALLEPYVEDPSLPPGQRARVYSTLSTAYVLSQRFGDALLLMHRALNLLRESNDHKLQAEVYQQAAWISIFTGDALNAKRYGELATKLATEEGLFEIAARAHSVLYNVATDIEDNPEETMLHLRAIADCGLKSGNSDIRLYALLGMYDQEAESGNAAALEGLARTIDSFEFTYGDRHSLETLVPAKALVAAGNADFEHALQLVQGSAARQMTDDRKAYRFSEIALYSAASGHSAEARDAVDAALPLVAELDPTAKRTLRSKINLLLANLVLGDDLAVADLLGQLEPALRSSSARIAVLVDAAKAVVGSWRGEENYSQVLAALKNLRRDYMGGLAAVLEALPRGVTAG